jgi:hypothetical protein
MKSMSDISDQVSDLFEAQSLIADASVKERVAQEEAQIANNDATALSQELKPVVEGLNKKVQAEILPGKNGEPSVARQVKDAFYAERQKLHELLQNKGSYSPRVFSYLKKRAQARIGALREKKREYDEFIKKYVLPFYIPSMKEAYERAKREPEKIKDGIISLYEAVRNYKRKSS